MTCVVGIEHQGKVYIGADSAGVSGWSLTVRADEKVFASDPFIMGFTSSFRMGQLLRYSLSVAGKPEDMDDVEYMSTWFINSVRSCLKSGGYAETENGRESGGTFLVGYHGSLYVVYSDYQVARPSDGYAAIGCGEDLALGALFVTKDDKPAPRIEKALEAAAHFSAAVCGPFWTVSA